MNLTASPILFAVVAFVGILLLLYLGHRFGKKMLSARDSGVSKGIGAIDGAVFALMGLLTAFTFSGAASRFEARRHLITQEANDIGTAWMRLDLLPADVQPSLREFGLTLSDLKTYKRGDRSNGGEADTIFKHNFGKVCKLPAHQSVCLCGHRIVEQCYLCPKSNDVTIFLLWEIIV